jgi:hypothetical protein
MSGTRVLLGSRAGFALRQRIYRFSDGVEVEEAANFVVTCRRVFFDDVLLVTHHRELGWPFLLVSGAVAAWLVLVDVGIGAEAGLRAGLVAFAVSGLPVLAAFGLRLALGVDVVTLFGKRTRCELHYWLRKRRAREVFQQLCAEARRHQETP